MNETTPTPLSSEPQRKLAAIMFTDMKGFSKKMEHDEAATMSLLRIHNKVMSETIASHGGTVIKTVGDAFLAAFDSTINAIHCASQIQKSFYEYNKNKPPEELIIVRAGIHVGDILLEDNDVFGEGVNIAARIQALAPAGGICVSEDVVRQTKGKLDIPLQRLGKGELKNIKLPVVIYKVALPWEEKSALYKQRFQFLWKRKKTKHIIAAAGAAMILAVWVATQTSLLSEHYTKSDLSIAVLPFVNTGDATNVYISEGLTDDITKHLTADSSLLVISQTSSFLYKKGEKPDSQIAKELGVRFLLNGALQMAGNSVKIRTTLFDAKKNHDVWDQDFNASRAGIFQAQEAIVGQVSNFFGLADGQLHHNEHEIPSQAYEPYLHGLYSLRQNTKDDNALAIEYFQEAVSLDSLFLKAYVNLSSAQARLYEQWDKSPTLLADASYNLQKVLQKNPNYADAIANLGFVERLKGNQTKALEHYLKALELDPRNLSAMWELSILYLFQLNEVTKALKYLTTIQEIEPTSAINYSNLGVAYGQLKNYPEATRAFLRSLEFNPNNDFAFAGLGYAYERQERYDSAMQYYRSAIEKAKLNPDYYTLLVSIMLVKEQYAEAESVLVDATKLLPGNHAILYALGLTYSLDKKDSNAKRIFQEGLSFVEQKLRKNPDVAEYHSDAGLFYARLGNVQKATQEAQEAFKQDSTWEQIVFNNARIYAVLNQKTEMLIWFQRAKAKNSEYDEAYLRTAMDFEQFRNDPDLLSIARQE